MKGSMLSFTFHQESTVVCRRIFPLDRALDHIPGTMNRFDLILDVGLGFNCVVGTLDLQISLIKYIEIPACLVVYKVIIFVWI